MQKPFLYLAAVVVIVFCVEQKSVDGQQALLTGGLSMARPADAATQALANQVQDTVQNLIDRVFTQFSLQSYKTQVVAGTNYYMKMLIQDTAGSQYVAHIKVFKPLRGDAVLTGLLFPDMWNDPISFDGYFSVAEK